MKKFVLIAMLIALCPAIVMGQNNRRTSRTEVSPCLDGRQKVRKADYDSIWKFTVFDAKKKYFCEFDYAQMETVLDRRHPQWGNMTPVMNYLGRMPRSPFKICAVFALNPNLGDNSQKDELIATAQKEALDALNLLQSWMTKEEMKNKVQIQVAQVDYRYWLGNDYFGASAPADDIIHVGFILYFGTKKVNLFPSAADGAKQFKAIKFFPNDATVVESYEPLLDELAQYLKENDRLEVLLQGYTDNVGTAAYCKGLARQRATEIKKKLIARGVADYRIEIEAKGAEDPIGDNSTYEGRIANNRVSITMQ